MNEKIPTHKARDDAKASSAIHQQSSSGLTPGEFYAEKHGTKFDSFEDSARHLFPLAQSMISRGDPAVSAIESHFFTNGEQTSKAGEDVCQKWCDRLNLSEAAVVKAIIMILAGRE